MRQTKNFTMKDYGTKSTFASFLPGISGVHGIPIWCYYVNRGQCVVSFGVDNKDHAIMEFYPAHMAYQNVKRIGFRTFLRVDGTYLECFSDEEVPHEMTISMNGLQIREENPQTKLTTTVNYYTLPGEKLGALVRCVEIVNTGDKSLHLEVLDGMPAVIPYGVGLDSMKNMTQTAKAWMQVEDADEGRPYFRVRASMDDSADVHSIEGGNFTIGCLPNGAKLQPVVDPELVFSYDNSLADAVRFKKEGLAAILQSPQITQNQIPCSFYGIEQNLPAKGSILFYEVIGQVESKELLDEFLAVKHDRKYFDRKKEEADALVADLCKGICTKTASPEFDAYCEYTYMDNVLRGGLPMKLGKDKVFYVYSRKHGDLERDYNYFSMLPEFYSQGNGNFRDVNQNRRCDTFFAPFVARENIKEFYSLIQLDGYNPLGVEKLTYQVDAAKAGALLASMDAAHRSEVEAVITKPFTPGTLYKTLEKVNEDPKVLFESIIDEAESTVNGNFGEGYWCDHWTYNLDLIEDYLEVYPEKEREMLYEEDYTYFLSQVNVNHRFRRYEKTPQGIRQYHALDEASKRSTEEKLVRADYGKGDILRVSLFEKLLVLCAVKYATLDAYGMGVEMEGGKPGWYDALNGMPGMLGSSMSETYELSRMLAYTIGALKKYPGEVQFTKEVKELLEKLHEITGQNKQVLTADGEVLAFWNAVNDAKEAYRDQTFAGISGEKEKIATGRLAEILEGFQKVVLHGIEKAYQFGGDICPTYFTYDVTEYEEDGSGIHPLKFKVQMVPYFLEGPVRYLKLANTAGKKKALYDHVKNSDLYDSKLSMYKVNASLENASYELGRARAFTPGWLENESIWLHMEYKYLLELLRSGMYAEFFADFHHAAVPFLDPKVYGRSIYENSSFIASSKNPNKNYHGKGFVARLSGSTIEFISMWKLMMFGRHVLTMENGALTFAPAPAIPSYLITEDDTVTATLFGGTEVEYLMQAHRDYIPGNYKITHMHFIYQNGSSAETSLDKVSGQIAEDIRSGRVTKIEINLE